MRSYFLIPLAKENLSKLNWLKTRIQLHKKLLRTNAIVYEM